MTVELADPAGRPVLSVGSVVGRVVSREQLGAGAGAGWVWRVGWRAVRPAAPVAQVRVAVLDWAQPSVPADADLLVLDLPAAVLAELPGADVPRRLRGVCARVVEVVQAVLAGPDTARLVVLTHRGVSVTGEDVDLAQAPVWGLIRAAEAENPGRFLLTDTDTDTDTERAGLPAPAELAMLIAAAGEPESAYRDGQLLTPRLVPHTLTSAELPDPTDTVETAESVDRVTDLTGPWHRDGTVLVTGGTSGLGALVARHLVTGHQVPRLLLVSRRGPAAPGATELAAELSQAGAAQVSVQACDLTDPAQLAELLATVPAGEPLGIVHAAAVMDNGLITGLTPDRLHTVLAAKADTAWYLHTLTRDRQLTTFTLFSSAGGLVLTAGQANYAAANAFLDALAVHRHHHHLTGTALSYGLWDTATGLNTDTDQATDRMSRQGLPALTPEQGLTALDHALTAPTHPHLIPLPVNHTHLTNPAPLLRPTTTKPTPTATTAATAQAVQVRRTLTGLTPEEREQRLRELILRMGAELLGWTAADGELSADQAFLDYGFDSLAALELRNQLQAATGLRLSATVVFDNRTPAALAAFLAGELEGTDPVGDTAPVPAAHEHSGIETVSQMFRTAMATSTVRAAFDLVAAMANVRPSFSSVTELGAGPRAVRLADGPGRPRILCISTPMATGGPYQLAQLGSRFRDLRPALGLPLYGFDDGDPLPATPEASIQSIAATAVTAAEGKPFVLLGYSAGGILARAAAAYLEEQDGVTADGVVMLDSYRTDPGQDEHDRRLVLAMLEKESSVGGFTMARLSSMGRYVELLPKLEVPAKLGTPVLFLQCGQPFAGDEDEQDGTSWQAQPWGDDDVVRTIPASHFSLLDPDAHVVVEAVESWLPTLR
jgi:NAD(P)-dependent dehydrogenase (short-subunit alcohol dehydrogenase family)/acyl carrier protein